MVGRSQVVQKWRRLIVDILFAFAAFTTWHTEHTRLCNNMVFMEARALYTLLCSVAGPDGSVQQRYHEYKACLGGRAL